MGLSKEQIENHIAGIKKKLRNDTEVKKHGYEFAKLFFQIKDYDSAIQYLNDYLTVDGRSFRAHKWMGRLYEVKCDVPRALVHYERSLHLKKDQRDLVLKVAELYCSIEKPPIQSLENCIRAVEQLDDSHPLVFSLTEKLHSLEGKFLFEDNNSWKHSLETTVEQRYEDFCRAGKSDGSMLMDMCIAILQSTGTKFRTSLSQDFSSVSWKNSVTLCGHLLKFDYFLYNAYVRLKSVLLKSKTVYHILVRELCGQFYYMCAQFLYFEENRTAFSSSHKEYSFQSQLGDVCLLVSLKATPPSVESVIADPRVGECQRVAAARTTAVELLLKTKAEYYGGRYLEDLVDKVKSLNDRHVLVKCIFKNMSGKTVPCGHGTISFNVAHSFLAADVLDTDELLFFARHFRVQTHWNESVGAAVSTFKPTSVASIAQLSSLGLFSSLPTSSITTSFSKVEESIGAPVSKIDSSPAAVLTSVPQPSVRLFSSLPANTTTSFSKAEESLGAPVSKIDSSPATVFASVPQLSTVTKTKASILQQSAISPSVVVPSIGPSLQSADYTTNHKSEAIGSLPTAPVTSISQPFGFGMLQSTDYTPSFAKASVPSFATTATGLPTVTIPQLFAFSSAGVPAVTQSSCLSAFPQPITFSAPPLNSLQSFVTTVAPSVTMSSVGKLSFSLSADYSTNFSKGTFSSVGTAASSLPSAPVSAIPAFSFGPRLPSMQSASFSTNSAKATESIFSANSLSAAPLASVSATPHPLTLSSIEVPSLTKSKNVTTSLGYAKRSFSSDSALPSTLVASKSSIVQQSFMQTSGSKLATPATFVGATAQQLTFSNGGKPLSDIVSQSAGKVSFGEGFAFQGAEGKLFSSKHPAGEEGTDNPEEEVDIDFKPIVSLPDTYIHKSLESDEEVLFVHHCKLFRFDPGSKQWKERGVGDMKILKHRESGKVRLLMRRDQILKICCNHYITEGMNLMPGNNERSWIWFTQCDYSDEEPKEEKMAIRFKHVEPAKEFKELFDKSATSDSSIVQPSTLSPVKAVEDTVSKSDASPLASMTSDSSIVQPFTLSSTVSSVGAVEDSVRKLGVPPVALVTSDSSITFKTPPKVVETDVSKSDAPPVVSVTSYPSTVQPFTLSSVVGTTISKSDAPPLTSVTTLPNSFAFSSFGKLSFADIISQSADKDSFGKAEGYVFQGAGSKLFSSKDPAGEEGTDNPEKEADIDFKPIVSLPDTYIHKSLESDEEVLFVHRCKLYRFDAGSKQWKERGVGDMKILKHRESGKVRLLMRRDQILKICCNHYITEGMNLMPGNNERSWIWFTQCDYSDEEPKEEKMAIRFKHVETANEFKDFFERSTNKLDSSSAKEVKQCIVQDPKPVSHVHVGPKSTDDEKTSEADEVLFIGEDLPQYELIEKAKKFQLPKCFYLYEKRDSCPGCRGCIDQDGEVVISNCQLNATLSAPVKSELTITMPFISAASNLNGPSLTPVTSDSSIVQSSPCSFVRAGIIKSDPRPQTPVTSDSSTIQPSILSSVGAVKNTVSKSGASPLAPVTSDSSVTFQRSKLSSLVGTTISKSDAPPLASVTSDSSTVQPFTLSSFVGTAISKSDAPPLTSVTTVPHSLAFSSFGKLSFADIISQSADTDSFRKAEGFVFHGAGSKLFSSKDPTGEEGTDNPEEEADIDFKPIVSLPDTYIHKSLESDEEVLFVNRCKLYRFDAGSKQWKERGVGDMKILKHRESGKVRLLMRRDQILKICCNHYITEGMNLMPGNNERSWIWFTQCDYSDEEPKEEKMAIRFKHAETANEFKNFFEKSKNLDSLSVNKVKQNVSIAKSAHTASQIHFEHTREEETSSIYDTDEVLFNGEDLPEPELVEKAKKFHLPEWFYLYEKKSPCPGCRGCKDQDSEVAPVTSDSSIVQPSTLSPVGAVEDTVSKSDVSLLAPVTSDSSIVQLSTLSPVRADEDTVSKSDVPPLVPDSSITVQLSALSSVVKTTVSKSDAPPLAPVTSDCSQPFELFSVVETTVSKSDAPSLAPATSDSSIDQSCTLSSAGAVEGTIKSDVFSLAPVTSDSSTVQSSTQLSVLMATVSKSNAPPLTSVTTVPQSFAFSSFGKLSFADIISQSADKDSFGKAEGFVFQGAGSKLFSSEDRAGEEGTDNPEEEADIDFKPIVSLPDTYIHKSLESDEEVLFVHRCKLYRFDAGSKQWKERGVGDMKILKHRESGKVRLLMRRDQILKICCNHYITDGMNLMPGSNERSWIWFTQCDYSDEEPKEEKMAIRFKHVDIAIKFKEMFENSAMKKVCPSDQRPIEDVTDPVPIASPSLSSDDDVLLIAEWLPEPELVTKARKFMLPDSFYLYEKKAPCLGCRGCVDQASEGSAACMTTEELTVPFNLPLSIVVEPSSLSSVEGSASKSDTPPLAPATSDSSIIQSSRLSSDGVVEDIVSKSGVLPLASVTSDSSISKSGSPLLALVTSDSSVFQPSARSSVGVGDDTVSKSDVSPLAPVTSDSSIVQPSTLSPVRAVEDTVSKSPVAPDSSITVQASALSSVEETTDSKSDALLLAPATSDSTQLSALSPTISKSDASLLAPATSDSTQPFALSSIVETTVSKSDAPLLAPATADSTQPSALSSVVERTVSKSDVPLLALVTSDTTIVQLCTLSSVGAVEDTVSKLGVPSVAPVTSDSSVTFKQLPAVDTNVSKLDAPPLASVISDSSTVQPFTLSSVVGTTISKSEAHPLESVTSDSSTVQPFTLSSIVGTTISMSDAHPLPSVTSDSSTVQPFTLSSVVGTTIISKSDTPPLTSVTTVPQSFASSSFGTLSFADIISQSADTDSFRKAEGFVFQGAGSKPFSSKDPAGEEGTANPEEEADIDFKPIVSLPDTYIHKSLESDEEVLFANRCKLYRFDAGSKEWKERGVGDMKILKHRESGKVRLLMRRDQILKICCNHYITEGMNLMPGNNERSWIWFTQCDYSDEVPKEEKMAIRFKHAETANEFKNFFEGCKHFSSANENNVSKTSPLTAS